MNKIYPYLICSLLFGLVNAQESIPFNTQYLISDKVLINPSYTGSTDNIVIKGTYNKQWGDFDGGPNTQTISTHFNLIDRVGVGAYFYRDENGPVSMTGANISAAYHIPLTDYAEEDRSKNQFSFGMSLSLFNQHYDWAKINPEDPNDPLLNGDKNIFLPYLNLGLSFAYSGFFGGFSVLDIPLGNNTPIVNSIEPTPTVYYLNLGYDWAISEEQFFIEPSILFNLNTNSERQLDLNLKAKYKFEENTIAAGISYRTDLDSEKTQNLTVTPFFQAEIGRLNLGVGYTIGMTDIYREGGNGFIIGLGYNIENVFNSRGFRYR